jgi:hypothetical protein
MTVDVFEVADQQHAEVAPGRQRRTAAHLRIVAGAHALHEIVECRRESAPVAAAACRTRAPVSAAAPTMSPTSLPDDHAAGPKPSESNARCSVGNEARHCDFGNGLLCLVCATLGKDMALLSGCRAAALYGALCISGRTPELRILEDGQPAALQVIVDLNLD